MVKFFEFYEIEDNILSELNFAGVWALFGCRDKKLYCLQVAETENIKKEITQNWKYICSQQNEKQDNVNYVNAFGEKLFEHPRIIKVKEYLYREISKKFNGFKVIIITNEKDRNKRRSIEKEFAHRIKAVYWRHGGAYKDGIKINYEERAAVCTIPIAENEKEKLTIEMKKFINNNSISKVNIS